MNTNNLLPISNLEEKEIYAGWYTSSSDGWDGGYLDPVDVFPPDNGGGWGGGDPWGGREDGTDIGSGGSGGNSSSGGHQLPGELNICTQLGVFSDCSYLALGAINKYLGGEELGIHKDDFAEYWNIAHNVGEGFTNILNGGGVSDVQLNNLVNDFYINQAVNNVDQISSQLDNGHPILATLVVGRHGDDIDGHAVVITGYDSATKMVTIADSLADGLVQSFQFDSSKLINMTAISGIKDNDVTDKYKNDSGDWWKSCSMGN